MSIVADWTCAKSLKPILRRWKRRSTKSLNPCNLVWTQYIKNHQDTPKNPNPKISPPCCPWSGANGRRFPGAPGRGGGLSGEPRGTVLQPCFNRASTVLQPFNQPSLHPWISPWNCCQIHPPFAKIENTSTRDSQFCSRPSTANLRHHYPTLCE